MAFSTHGTQRLTLTTGGSLRVGIAAPGSSLQVVGNVGTSLGQGIHAGMNPTLTTNANLGIIAGSSTAKAQLGFGTPSGTFNKNGMIEVDTNTNNEVCLYTQISFQQCLV